VPVLVFELLLALHIALGTVALGAGGVAMVAAKGGRAHRLAGRVFVPSLAVALATALALSVLHPNAFLFVIALFSGYLLLTGWRAAKVVRHGTGTVDRLAAWAMLLIGAGMLGAGAATAAGAAGDVAAGGAGHRPWVLIVFGAIGAGFALGDLRRAARGGVRGAPRIVQHLGRIGGAFVATVTAVAVVNLETVPDLVAWLGPTVLLSPVLAWFAMRTLRGARRGDAQALADERSSI
jgi:uncharacterized membrane protein